jgi:hypothetical protein
MLNQNMNNRDREPWSPKHERKTMNNKFDELTKSLAQSVTRRTALKKFGVGLAGMALACFGLAGKAEAGPKSCSAHVNCPPSNPHCCQGKRGHCSTYTCPTDPNWSTDQAYCVFNCPPF